MKIVEHEGMQYSVPDWTTYITRDDGDISIDCWEYGPVLRTDAYGQIWRLQRGRVEYAVRVSNKSSFIKKI